MDYLLWMSAFPGTLSFLAILYIFFVMDKVEDEWTIPFFETRGDLIWRLIVMIIPFVNCALFLHLAHYIIEESEWMNRPLKGNDND